MTSAPRKKISIRDNGRGMSSSDLRKFFQMHGENQDRAAGRRGRGYFGTGKSAAFGIANLLRITTVRENRRCVVELHRCDVDATSTGAAVPVRQIEVDQSVKAPNGTLVEIEEIRNVRIDRDEIRRTLERHIRYWRRAVVEFNGQTIEHNYPPIVKTKYFTQMRENLNFSAEQHLFSMLRRHRYQNPIEAWLFSLMIFFTRQRLRARSQRKWSTMFLVR